MSVVLGMLGIVFFGFLLTLILVPKISLLSRIALGYLLGTGLITLFMFLAYLAGLRFTFENTAKILIFSLIILVFPALFLKNRLEIKKNLREVTLFFRETSSFEKIIFGIILFFLLSSFIITVYYPVSHWDALALYDWRAKTFVDTGGMEEGITRGFFFGYPLMTSLAHTFIYLFGGKNPQFTYSLIFIGFAILFYGALREFTSRKISLLVTLALITIPGIFDHSTIAYTNLPYSVYYVMGTIYLYIWMVKQKPGYLALSVFLVGLSSWIRSSEPFWLANLGVLIFYCLWKRKFLVPIFYSLIFFSIQQPWKIFEARMFGSQYSTIESIQTSVSVLATKLSIVRIIEVLIFVLKNAIVPDILFWGLFLVVVLIQIKEIFKEKNLWFLALILANLLLLFVGSYIFSFTYPEWKGVPGSMVRMVMFFLPLLLYYFGISDVGKKFLGE